MSDPAGRSSRRLISWGVLLLGVLLLLVVPVYLVLLAFSGDKNTQLPGPLLILTVVGGMGLVLIGAALRE